MPFDPPPAQVTTPDHDVLIIGAGFSGLGTAIQLRKAGFDNFLILEKEQEVGGTWYVNSYPGCACDIYSHVYSFSFEPNPDWSRAYSGQPEILAYLKRCADKYQLRPQVRFKAHVLGAAFDDQSSLWRVSYADADAIAAYQRAHGLAPGDSMDLSDPALPTLHYVTTRTLICGVGPLSTPAYPHLKGIENFKGETFHSQQWKHDYDLTGKRVAVVGTGASAIQFVPEIQPHVAHLDLYQRTPPWVLPKPDRAIPEKERWIYRNIPGARWLQRTRLYWWLESFALGFAVNPKLTNYTMKFAKSYLERKVADPALRAKLMPDYNIGCKRVLMSKNYIPALTQPNVDLVTNGIREVRDHSIVDAQGVERPVDAIIYGTGFRVADLLPKGMIFGSGGRDIFDAWKESPEAYKGTTVAGFPNLFVLVGPNVGLGHNSIIFMIESQINYIVGALKLMRAKKLARLEVRAEQQARFNDWVQKRSKQTVWVSGGCKSYYLHPQTGRNFALWPTFTFTFRNMTRHFDAKAYTTQPLPALGRSGVTA